MFEELGLNVARQEDNAANPRPDNRSGWLEGDAPRRLEPEEEPPFEIDVRMWDPSRQLRFARKRQVPERPDGAPNAAPPAVR
jgi:biotin synthase